MTRTKMYLTVALSVALLAAVWYAFYPYQYESSTEVRFVVDNRTTVDGVAGDFSDLSFRVKSALEYMKKRSVMEDLEEKYLQCFPRCSRVKAKLLLESIAVEMRVDDSLSLHVRSSARTFDDASCISEFYADNIVQYFADEKNSRIKKISAWFDQQMYHRKRRLESVSDLEKNKRMILEKETCRSLQAVKVGVRTVGRSRFSRFLGNR